jgi:hypothetical protein
MTRFEGMLAQCIDDVKAGRSSLEDCLARHPSFPDPRLHRRGYGSGRGYRGVWSKYWVAQHLPADNVMCSEGPTGC